MTLGRREALRGFALALVPWVQQGGQKRDSAATGRGAADELFDPYITGREAAPVTKWDNDPGIIAIERKLRCECGCTLDVYTCRTTDFTCTYSPEMHRTIVSQITAGRTPEEVIAFYVAKDGEQVLTAPPAEGFNLAGYLVPGLTVLALGLALAAYLSRRRQAVAAVEAAAPVPPHADPEAMARLRRALDDVES